METPTGRGLSTTKGRRAREYETVCILRSGVHPEQATAVVGRLTDTIGNLKGRLIRLDNWGVRRLAYPIRGQTKGIFVCARFAGYEDLVAELERNLRLLDEVMRYQTVLLKPSVVIDEIEVDPEDIQFRPVEVIEEEEEIGIAHRLGLVDRAQMARAQQAAAAEAEGRDEAEEGQEEAETTDEGAEAAAEAAEASGEQKPGAEAEPSGEKEPSGEAEASGEKEPSGEAEASGEKEPSGEAEASGEQEPGAEAEASDEREPSGEAEAAAPAGESGETDGPGSQADGAGSETNGASEEEK